MPDGCGAQQTGQFQAEQLPDLACAPPAVGPEQNAGPLARGPGSVCVCHPSPVGDTAPGSRAGTHVQCLLGDRTAGSSQGLRRLREPQTGPPPALLSCECQEYVSVEALCDAQCLARTPRLSLARGPRRELVLSMENEAGDSTRRVSPGRGRAGLGGDLGAPGERKERATRCHV